MTHFLFQNRATFLVSPCTIAITEHNPREDPKTVNVVQSCKMNEYSLIWAPSRSLDPPNPYRVTLLCHCHHLELHTDLQFANFIHSTDMLGGVGPR